MDRRQILLDLRNKGKLKGLKPAFVLMKQDLGGIYTGGTGDYIMSYRNGILYFQRLSFFFHVLKPKEDLQYKMGMFTEYYIETKNTMKIMYLYRRDGKFLKIHYLYGTKETYASEDNIARILKELEALGIKQTDNSNYVGDPDEEGIDDNREESN